MLSSCAVNTLSSYHETLSDHMHLLLPLADHSAQLQGASDFLVPTPIISSLFPGLTPALHPRRHASQLSDSHHAFLPCSGPVLSRLVGIRDCVAQLCKVYYKSLTLIDKDNLRHLHRQFDEMSKSGPTPDIQGVKGRYQSECQNVVQKRHHLMLV
ncbi:hypothetical protein BDZ97DRAFT_450228 [Flammula alnicola]|nr:hypothetical protein BDZ97DRAFT_450228 [Flammula alnicola]